MNLSDAGSRYNLGFTAASLRPELARIVAAHYLATGSWDEAKQRVLETNALQSRTAASAIRMEREFRQRLGTLSHAQLSLLADATAEDTAAMAWLAAIKHTAFIFQFASELLRDKLGAHDLILRHSDYESYVEAKAVRYPQLAQLTDASKSKLRRVLLRMLAEADLITPGTALGTIHRPVLSPVVVQVITHDDPRWLAGFLVPETEIALP